LRRINPQRAGLQRVGKSHFSPRYRLLRRGALPLRFVEIAKPQLGDADSVGFERLPNQLAANPDSSIIVS
jgi:hypothetical protein